MSFAVPKGQALGIIGPNGAGKSTLFNLITGNILPDAGTITFLGRDVTRMPRDGPGAGWAWAAVSRSRSPSKG